jgi:hypothetical protein
VGYLHPIFCFSLRYRDLDRHSVNKWSGAHGGDEAVCQDKWGKIILEEVYIHVVEVPGRCGRLVKTGGAPIKSNLW